MIICGDYQQVMSAATGNGDGATNGSDRLGFEKKLWAAADALRSNMDAAEYKHVVLGLIFLKCISDSFEEMFEKLRKEPEADEEGRRRRRGAPGERSAQAWICSLGRSSRRGLSPIVGVRHVMFGELSMNCRGTAD